MSNATTSSFPPALPQQAASETAISAREERQWGLLTHLSALSGYIGVPMGSIIGPLVVWLLKRDQSAFLDEHGKEAMNFHLSIFLYLIISIPLLFVLIGFVTIFVLPILEIIFTIIAAVKASEGEAFRFPFTIRFID